MNRAVTPSEPANAQAEAGSTRRTSDVESSTWWNPQCTAALIGGTTMVLTGLLQLKRKRVDLAIKMVENNSTKWKTAGDVFKSIFGCRKT